MDDYGDTVPSHIPDEWDARRMLVQTIIKRTQQRDEALAALEQIARESRDGFHARWMAREALTRINPAWAARTDQTPSTEPYGHLQQPPPPKDNPHDQQ